MSTQSDIGTAPFPIPTKWVPRISATPKSVVFQTSAGFGGDVTNVEDNLVDRTTIKGQEILPDTTEAGFFITVPTMLLYAACSAACEIYLSQYDPAVTVPILPDRFLHKLNAVKFIDNAGGGGFSFPEIVLPAGHFLTIISGAAVVVTMELQELTTWRV